jgi:hypothetical protein
VIAVTNAGVNLIWPCYTTHFVLGSVNGGNCKVLAAQPDVDGFLVGGASLKVYPCLLSIQK